MTLSVSARLRMQQERGMVIVCSIAPHEGEPVTHSPRFTTDPQPWTLTRAANANHADLYRYSGRECRAQKEA